MLRIGDGTAMMFGSNGREDRQKTIVRAERARDSGQWVQAAENYRQALSLDRQNAPVWIQYGVTLRELGDLTSAETAFRSAIAVNLKAADAHLQLARLLKIKGRTEEAVIAFRRAMALDAALCATSRDLLELSRNDPATATDDAGADDTADDGDERPNADRRSEPARQLIEKSGLFDEDWYLAHYPETQETGLAPLDHYLTFGWVEGREPGPDVDTARYADLCPESVNAQANPVLHFIMVGAAQGMSCLSLSCEKRLIAGSPLFDADWYRANNPDVGTADPLDHYIAIGAAKGRSPGPLFDAKDYSRRNPKIAAARGNPLLHYILVGAGRGRSFRSTDRQAEKDFILKSGQFSRRAYGDAYPEVAENDLDPLDHYIDQGAAEGRSPGPLFDAAAYLAKTPDVATAGGNPLLNSLIADTVTCPVRVSDREDEKAIISRSGLFDAAWYAQRNPDGLIGTQDPLDHYLDQPPGKRPPPSADFDTRDYLARYPEIASAGFEPLLHYIVIGIVEHRMIYGVERSRDRETIARSGLFDSDWYRHTYSDVAGAGADPIDHYLQYGARQGRIPGPLFDAADYVARNDDVRAAHVNPLLHYITVGKNEGRQIRPIESRQRKALHAWAGWPEWRG